MDFFSKVMPRHGCRRSILPFPCSRHRSYLVLLAVIVYYPLFQLFVHAEQHGGLPAGGRDCSQRTASDNAAAPNVRDPRTLGRMQGDHGE